MNRTLFICNYILLPYKEIAKYGTDQRCWNAKLNAMLWSLYKIAIKK